VFKRSLLKGPPPAFILELPTYKLPQLSQVARQVWFNTSKFLTKAGTIIFALSIVLWAMTYYPRLPDDRLAAVTLQAEESMPRVFREGVPSLPVDEAPHQAEQMEAARASWVDEAVASEQLRYSIAGGSGTGWSR
jgi:ferrous iron transport protein B